MIWLLVVILLFVLIISTSKGSKKKNLEMEKLRKDIAEQPKAEVSPISAAEEISKLKKLLDEGVLTQEEFETQKKKILA